LNGRVDATAHASLPDPLLHQSWAFEFEPHGPPRILDRMPLGDFTVHKRLGITCDLLVEIFLDPPAVEDVSKEAEPVCQQHN
jgi:hypothetical protein